MRKRERFYDAGLRALEPASGLLARLHPKGEAAMRGRVASRERFETWGTQHRDPQKPLVLLHAPSVGEALMAQAIIEKLRLQLPTAQFAFTFFSPSAERIADRIGADVSGYLPIDTTTEMKRLVAQLRPAVVGFVRTEIWPMLGLTAQAAGASVALVNAVLGARSSRLRGPARFMLGPAYRRLDAIGAVAQDDAARFAAFLVSADHVFVTGDARFDQVWTRVQSLDRNAPLLRNLRDDRALLVAGSTWPADEAVLLRAVADLPAAIRPRVLIAPHEPTSAHIEAIEARIAELVPASRYTRLSTFDATNDADFVIIDRLGILADLYAVATVSYVGGGFGEHGLHSVIEPAALAVPVIYGPRHGNAREARELAAEGGGFIVNDAGSLTGTLGQLLGNATAQKIAGNAAQTFVQSRLGGADANAALLSGLIARPF